MNHTNPDREARCLSSLMKGAEDALAAISAGLSADHFSEAENRLIFGAIKQCAANGIPPEAASLWPQLATLRGESAVTLARLAEVEALEPTSVNRPRLVEDVKGLAKQRRLIASLSSGLEAAQADGKTFDEVMGGVSPHLRAAQDCAIDARSFSLADFAAKARESITNPTATGFFGPFAGWDRATGRLRPGEVCVLAARPGTGKTALALQYATHAALHGVNVVVFSLEMTGAELLLRVATQRAGVQGLGGADREKRHRLAALDEIEGNRHLFIYEAQAAYSLDQIEARCRLHGSSVGGLGLVVIDYLQLIAPPSETRRDHRERQVAEMSRRIKLLAQSLGVPVLLLAQMNRQVELNDRRPKLSDLRESGAIEQDADRVWFLHSPPPPADQPIDSQAERVSVELIQAKARNGPPWVVADFSFHRPSVTFVPILSDGG